MFWTVLHFTWDWRNEPEGKQKSLIKNLENMQEDILDA